MFSEKEPPYCPFGMMLLPTARVAGTLRKCEGAPGTLSRQTAPTPETMARTSPPCTGIGVGKVKLATEIVPGPVVTMLLRPTTWNLFAVVLSGRAITSLNDDVLPIPGLV